MADNARLEAWADCFRSQSAGDDRARPALRGSGDRPQRRPSSSLQLGRPAGVAKARQVRGRASPRLGRVGDCEAELDLALTAARAAEDRRRVTAVLGAAPIAALWGPEPGARAGGRCLDVIRLLRITDGSPAVEAVSVRCQAVLEALRGRFDTARHHARHLAPHRRGAGPAARPDGNGAVRRHRRAPRRGPAAAEPHLRAAHAGLGKLGIGADAGQAAAYLARSLLLQNRIEEAEDLADEADALAGQNLQTVIAARSVQAEILAARGDTGEALALAEEAVRLAAGTDIILDHANALATLARVRTADGDLEGAERASTSARELFTQKGATVLVDSARQDRPAPADRQVGPDERSSESPSPIGETSEQPWNTADSLTRLIARG